MKFKFFKKEMIILGSAIFIAVALIAMDPFFENKLEAQTSTTPAALYIGGYTLGPGKTKCCNGTSVAFSSIDLKIPVILNGEALFIPGVSQTLLYGKQLLPSYCTLGFLVPGACLTAASECQTPVNMPMILYVGTSFASCVEKAAAGAVVPVTP